MLSECPLFSSGVSCTLLMCVSFHYSKFAYSYGALSFVDLLVPFSRDHKIGLTLPYLISIQNCAFDSPCFFTHGVRKLFFVASILFYFENML